MEERMTTPNQFGGRSNIWATIKEAYENGFYAFGPFSRYSGKGFVGNAKMTYDFAVDGGAIGVITPADSPLLPAGAIIIGGVIDVTTTVTSGGAATISLGTTSQAGILKAAVILGAEFLMGLRAVIPLFTVATMAKLTSAGRLSMTVAAFPLTAGKFDLNVTYIVGN